jgi:hypothetical protein
MLGSPFSRSSLLAPREIYMQRLLINQLNALKLQTGGKMTSIFGRITEELPAHQVLVKSNNDDYEIRKYAPCLVASVRYVSFYV